MFRRKHPKRPIPAVRPVSIQSDPTTTNTEVVKQPGWTTDVVPGQETIQGTKSMHTPSLSQIVERRTWEHGQLRQKLSCLQKKYRAALNLYEVVAHVSAVLEEAILDFNSLNIDPASDMNGKFSLPSRHAGTSLARTPDEIENIRNSCEASQERLPTRRRTPTLDLSQKIEERTQENMQLEQELAYLETKQRAVTCLYKEMSSVVRILKEALYNFNNLKADVEDYTSAPPALTRVDIEIAMNHGSTMAIETSQGRIQAEKRMPTPDLPQMIRERTDQIIYLEQELAFMDKKHRAAEYLYHEVHLVLISLQKALVRFQAHSINDKHE
jgi:hypothetical protein